MAEKANALYRGYLPTCGKRAKIPFKNVKNDDLPTYEQIKHEREFAGVLNYNTILIDVDDEYQSDVLFKIVEDEGIKCRVYKTFRGKHFLMFTSRVNHCYTHCKLACGVSNVDIKIGNAYEVLKLNGKEREILLDFDEYDVLPNWMMPIKTNLSFEGLTTGAGRNDVLFKFVTELKKAEIEKPDIIKAVEIINNYQFEIPLPTEELYATVLRDEYLDKDASKVGSKDLFSFAKAIQEEYHIKRINGDVFAYIDGVYINNQKEIERKIIEADPSLKSNLRTEVLKYIDLITTKEVVSDPNYIAFSNGVYSIKDDRLFDFSPDYTVINKINHRYNPYAESQVVTQALKDFARQNNGIVKLLEEMVGYCLYRRNELRKAFILVGEKQSGKSTFLEMLQYLIGLNNCAFLDIKELNERFKPAELSGKLVNIGDDISDGYIGETSVFKKLVTGNPLTVERKNQHPFGLKNYSKFIFSANAIPRIKDVGGGIYSRLIFVPFTNNFANNMDTFDLEIIDKLKEPEAIEYLILIGLKGLRRVLQNKEFTVPSESDDLMAQYKIENDSVESYIDDVGLESLKGRTTSEVYTSYCVFCGENGLKARSKIALSKALSTKHHVIVNRRSINGRQVRVYDIIS